MEIFKHICKELIIKSLKTILTEDEQNELDQIIAKYPQLKLFLDKIKNESFVKAQYEVYKQFDANQDWKIVSNNMNEIKKPSHIKLYIAKVAAALLIPLIVGYVLVVTNQIDNLKDLFAETEINIEPGKSEATLILSNGETVLLDYSQDTLLFEAGSKIIIDKNGGIKYIEEKLVSKIKINDRAYQLKELPLNTLKINRGREFFLTLSDGTKVWINSETELKFPVSFRGNKREVYLKGEAYFEVSENKEKSFIVHSKKMDIKVMGTSFNVMDYEDETDVRTTLVEGQVIVSDPNNNYKEIILSPNQQVIIDANGMYMKDVNSSLITEWRNNSFGFEYENLITVVNKLSRWYNIDFTYADETIKILHFSGKIPKYENISTALDLLELTTNIHFKFKGDKIIIEKENI
jgi:outer membrane lipoprotein-sorting protein